MLHRVCDRCYDWLVVVSIVVVTLVVPRLIEGVL